MLQERLRQSLLRDSLLLRSVGHPPSPGAPVARDLLPRPPDSPLLPLQAQPPPASPATGKLLPDAMPAHPGPPAPSCPLAGLPAQSLQPQLPPWGPARGALQPPVLSPIKQPLPAALVAASPSRCAPGQAAPLLLASSCLNVPEPAQLLLLAGRGGIWKGLTRQSPTPSQRCSSSPGLWANPDPISPRVPSLCPCPGLPPSCSDIHPPAC